MERIAIAFLAGFTGLFAGLLVWFCFGSMPGFKFGANAYLSFSYVLAGTAFMLALFKPETTLEFLGNFMQRIWAFYWEVLRWFRRLQG